MDKAANITVTLSYIPRSHAPHQHRFVVAIATGQTDNKRIRSTSSRVKSRTSSRRIPATINTAPV